MQTLTDKGLQQLHKQDFEIHKWTKFYTSTRPDQVALHSFSAKRFHLLASDVKTAVVTKVFLYFIQEIDALLIQEASHSMPKTQKQMKRLNKRCALLCYLSEQVGAPFLDVKVPMEHYFRAIQYKTLIPTWFNLLDQILREGNG